MRYSTLITSYITEIGKHSTSARHVEHARAPRGKTCFHNESRSLCFHLKRLSCFVLCSSTTYTQNFMNLIFSILFSKLINVTADFYGNFSTSRQSTVRYPLSIVRSNCTCSSFCQRSSEIRLENAFKKPTTRFHTTTQYNILMPK